MVHSNPLPLLPQHLPDPSMKPIGHHPTLLSFCFFTSRFACTLSPPSVPFLPVTPSVLSCRPHHVRHSLQHGTHQLAPLQDRDPAHRLGLRGGQHAHHDPDGDRCPPHSGRWGICQVPAFCGETTAFRRYADVPSAAGMCLTSLVTPTSRASFMSLCIMAGIDKPNLVSKIRVHRFE